MEKEKLRKDLIEAFKATILVEQLKNPKNWLESSCKKIVDTLLNAEKIKNKFNRKDVEKMNEHYLEITRKYDVRPGQAIYNAAYFVDSNITESIVENLDPFYHNERIDNFLMAICEKEALKYIAPEITMSFKGVETL